jgi:hypothetical protein
LFGTLVPTEDTDGRAHLHHLWRWLTLLSLLQRTNWRRAFLIYRGGHNNRLGSKASVNHFFTEAVVVPASVNRFKKTKNKSPPVSLFWSLGPITAASLRAADAGIRPPHAPQPEGGEWGFPVRRHCSPRSPARARSPPPLGPHHYQALLVRNASEPQWCAWAAASEHCRVCVAPPHLSLTGAHRL